MTDFYTYQERPDLWERYRIEADSFWPDYMEWIDHDPVCEEFWPRLTTDFGAFQFLVYDESDDRFLAHANTIPLAWSGKDDDLAAGVPAVLKQGFAEKSDGAAPTTLCALLAAIQPNVRSRGLSAEILKFMKEIARRHGLTSLIAPVRPNFKERYPLTPMERYAEWRREDGLLFDPWLRTHERLGARFAGIAPEGNIFRGSISEWEKWTGLTFPESGEYVIRGAMNPVRIDRESDEGVLIESNVWMVHPVEPAS